MTTGKQSPPSSSQKYGAGLLGGSATAQWFSLILAVPVLGCLLVLPLDWTQQLFLGIALIVAALAISRFSSRYSATLVLVALSVFSSSRYLYYRFVNTFGVGPESGPQPRTLDMVFMVLLLAAELYAFVILLFGYFQTIRPLGRKPIPLPHNADTWPTVDVFIPTYNEPLSLVRHTVWAALNLDWPRQQFKVYILDDGRREDFRRFAAQVGCEYITRPDNTHAKAGNINNAIRKTDGEYVAVFDCDHVPTRSFLQIAMGWFLADARLGMLQTPHLFYSPDPFERNLKQFHKIPNEGELFYGLVQDGNDLWNSAFFCGSCAVLRRAALEEVGGIATETVTEDAHTSLRIQLAGWNTAYLNIPQAAGLATESLASHVGQRIRWARGMIQTLRVDNPLIRPGLTAPQRVCYFNAMLHFLYAVPRLIFLVSPLIYLLFGYLNIRGYSLTILAYALPHIVLATMSNSRIQAKYRYSFWNEVHEAVLSPYILLPTLLALLSPKLGKFNVTAKGGLVRKSFFDRRIARPFVGLLLLNLLGLVFAGLRLWRWDSQHVGTIVMNSVWTVFNLVIIGVACAVSYESRQSRAEVRVALRSHVLLTLADGRTFDADTTDISSSGVALRVPRGIGVADNDRVTIRFSFRFTRHDLPAFVVGDDSGLLRLKFEPLDLAEEEELTRVLYSRADSWLAFNEQREPDNPLRSFGLLFRLSFRGIGVALRSLWGGGSKESPRNESVTRVEAHTAADVGTRSAVIVKGSLLLVAGALCLHGAYAHAASSSQNKSSAHSEAQTVSTGREPAQGSEKPVAAAGTFHTVLNLGSLAGTKALSLQGADSRASVHFALPNSEVVTSASLEVHYRLASQLAGEASHLNILVNGTAAASIPLLQSSDNRTNRETAVTIPSDFLLTDNTIEFVVAGVCSTSCTTSDVLTTIDPGSLLELDGSRLTLANDLATLPAPFLDLAKQSPGVIFAFLTPPDSNTLRAAGAVASWLGIATDYRGVKFTATVGAIPPGNAIVLGPAASLPASLGLANVTGPTVSETANPSDPFSKLLVFTGGDEEQVLQAARSVALGLVKLAGDTTAVTVSDASAGRSPDDAPRWIAGNQQIELGDLFKNNALRLNGFVFENFYFRLAPDLYFGNRGGVDLHFNFRLDGVPPQRKTQLRVYLNSILVATVPIFSDGTPIQHATVVLPITALQPYSNNMQLSWEPVDWGGPATGMALQVMRNSSIDFRSTPHFLDMPKLERFSEAGYPFTRFADLSRTAVVLADNQATGLLSEYLDLMGFFGAQTGYPAIGISVVPPSEEQSVRDKDLILLGRYSDGDLVSSLGSNFPVIARQNSVHLSPTDDWWMKLRRSAWNPQGRNRQTIEDMLESDPRPVGVIVGSESPFQRGHSLVAILSEDDPSANALGAQLSGVVRQGAIYGSISVFYNGRFESLYLVRDTYEDGALPPYQSLNLWFVRRVYLLPVWILFSAWLLSLWIQARVERQARLRLAGRS